MMLDSTNNRNYILITPAYNEEDNLPRLFKSVLAQEARPAMWIIVNDGSSDNTGRLIDEKARSYDFIKGLHLKRDSIGTYYGRKVCAFNKGYELLKSFDVNYSFIGNLDADISMTADYYDCIIEQFIKNERLGIAGGTYIYNDSNIVPILHESCVPGSILMFRRECFEQIGGYLPLKYGAEDSLVCIMARSESWETAFLPRLVVTQQRVVGTAANTGILKARFRQGLSEYDIGYHPLFVLLKFLRRSIIEKPYLVGALARCFGYICGPFFIKEVLPPKKAIRFLRREQLRRILSLGRSDFSGHSLES